MAIEVPVSRTRTLRLTLSLALQCAFCPKRFSRSDHLQKHAKRHPQYHSSSISLTTRKSTTTTNSSSNSNNSNHSKPPQQPSQRSSSSTITKPECKIEITEEDGTMINGIDAELLTSLVANVLKK